VHEVAIGNNNEDIRLYNQSRIQNRRKSDYFCFL